MQSKSVLSPNRSSYRIGERKPVSQLVAELKQCAKARDLEHGKRLHNEAVITGLYTSKYVASVLITMYSRCACIHQAKEVFDQLLNRDVVCWTNLILGYVENGKSLAALNLFYNMSCEPDAFTFVAALKACGSLSSEREGEKHFCLETGSSIHKQVRDRGLESEMAVATTLIDMYRKCGCIHKAREVFERMIRRDVVAWTSLMLGYVENGESSVALELFSRMDCEPDSFTYVALLKAYTGLASEKESEKQLCLEKGIALHAKLKGLGLDSGIVLETALVDMYCKCGSMARAREVFDRMVQRNVITWTSLILGYVDNHESSVALDMFTSMNCEPTSVTYIGALKACGSLSAQPVGQRIHAKVCQLGLVEQLKVANSLMDFYVKCGNLEASAALFDGINTPSTVSWNTMIAGYSSLGCSSQAFGLVKVMEEAGTQMDGITFVGILNACSHAGLVKDGRRYFESMARRGISYGLEHYNCMVDVLGRANRLQEAMELVTGMPFEGDDITWRTLLAACRKWKNTEVGKFAFDSLVASGGGTKTAAPFVMMSDIYGFEKLEKEQPSGKGGQTWWCDHHGKMLKFVSC